MASRQEQKKKARAEREAAQKAADDAAARRRRTAFLAGGVALIALIVIVALVVISQGDDGSDTQANADSMFSGVPMKGIAMGEPDAPVTVVEFADLQCPFCHDFAVEDLPGIIKDYVKPGDVRMELRLLAFIGPDSEAGRGVAAGAAEQDLIWPFTENIYNNQGTENSGYMTTEFLTQQAEAVPGLDVEQAFNAADSDFARRYAAESEQEARDAGISSTPSFTVTAEGGEPKTVDADGLSDAIDEALAQSSGGK